MQRQQEPVLQQAAPACRNLGGKARVLGKRRGKQLPCLPSAALGTGPVLCERTLAKLKKWQLPQPEFLLQKMLTPPHRSSKEGVSPSQHECYLGPDKSCRRRFISIPGLYLHTFS